MRATRRAPAGSRRGPQPGSALDRRRLLIGAGAAVAVVAFPALAAGRDALPRMTDGPFYPSSAYRARALDWDADLTVVARPRPRRHAAPACRRRASRPATARSRTATAGPIDGATVEIWQCDVFGSYRHPRGAGARIDAGFQGFGSTPQRRPRPLPVPHHPAGALQRAGRRTSTSSCAIRRSARSPRSCSSPAIPATRATSSIAASRTPTARRWRCGRCGPPPAAR